MGALLALALAAALPVAVLPIEPGGLPAEAVHTADQAVRHALPAPWEAARLDAATLAEHLAAVGPACRTDLLCLCSVAALDEQAIALDLRLEKPSTQRGWSADLRLVRPCGEVILDRRAASLEPTPAALQRFLSEAVVVLLRGRDLGSVRWSGRAAPAPTPATEAPRPASTKAVLEVTDVPGVPPPKPTPPGPERTPVLPSAPH